MMQKKLAKEEEIQLQKNKDQQVAHHEEEKTEERAELEETQVSKNLASAMVKSSLANESETLQRVVDVLQNQNGKYMK